MPITLHHEIHCEASCKSFSPGTRDTSTKMRSLYKFMKFSQRFMHEMFYILTRLVQDLNIKHCIT